MKYPLLLVMSSRLTGRTWGLRPLERGPRANACPHLTVGPAG
ncbi:hypothetical protein [Cellulosimicrobium sp. Marseille-Q8652]